MSDSAKNLSAEGESATSTSQELAKSKPPSLLKAAGLIAAVTVFSKILGFVRDWAMMYVYGASLPTDAYFAAFQLPAFAIVLVGGLGGPFHTATVAVFSRLIKDGELPDERAKKLASTFVTLTGIACLLLSVLVYFCAEPIMATILSGAQGGVAASADKARLIALSAEQLRIMSPVIFAGGIVGIFYGLLNLYHVFFWPSLSPTAMSVTILLGLFLWPDPDGRTLAWATLAGAFLQVLIQLPDFFRRKFTLKPAFDWKSDEVRQVGEMLFPMIIGTTIGQLMTYVDMFFASDLGDGAWSAVILGNRLIQLPIGVLQTAFLVPIFPRFTRYVNESNWEELRNFFKTGVVALWFISMPMLVLILLYTEPLVRLIFQHGKFDAGDTLLVSQAIVFLAYQIIPYFARDSITRVFYAFQDSKTPLMVGMFAILVKAFLDWLFVVKMHMDVGGITFSTTLVTALNMVLLGVLSKRHIRDLGFKAMVAPFYKLVVSAVVMVAIMLLLGDALEAVRFSRFISSPVVIEVISITLSACVGLFIYGVTALAFKVPEAHYLAERVTGLLESRLRRRGNNVAL